MIDPSTPGEQGFADVIGLKIGIQRQDGVSRLALRDESDDGSHRDAKSAHARDASQLAGIRRDSLELHRPIVDRPAD